MTVRPAHKLLVFATTTTTPQSRDTDNYRTNCYDHPDPDLFFDEERVEEAKAVCFGCPLVDDCASIGGNEHFGVWGGVEATPELPHERARRMVEDGASNVEIGEELDISERQVKRIVNGIRDAMKAERNEQWLKLHESGVSQLEIARRFEVSDKTVWRGIKEARDALDRAA